MSRPSAACARYRGALLLFGLGLSATPISSAEVASGPTSPFRFFPATTLTWRSASAGTSVWIEFYQNGVLMEGPWSVARNPSGDFVFTLTCQIVGPARVKMVDPASGDLLRAIDVLCEPPEEPLPPGGSGSGGGSGGEAAPLPPMSPGRVEAFTASLDSTTTDQTVTTTEDGTQTIVRSVTSAIVDAFSDAQICRSEDVEGEECCSTTADPNNPTTGLECPDPACTPIDDSATSCSPSPPLPLSSVLTFVSSSAGTTTVIDTTRQQSSGTVLSTIERTSTEDSDATIELTFVFPDVLPEQTIDRLRLHAANIDDVFVFGPLSAFEAEGTGSPEVFIPTLSGPFTTLPGPCANSLRAKELTWELPGSTQGNHFTVRLRADRECSSTSSSDQTFDLGSTELQRVSSGTSTFSTMSNARFKAEALAPPLTLEPLDTHLAPIFPQSPLGFPVDFLGKVETTLRAGLFEVPPGAYEVEIEVVAFDAVIGGHEHGSPAPSGSWGLFPETEETPGVAPSITCQITVDASGEGFCEVVYQTSESAGRVSFRASTTINGQPEEATASVETRIPNLSAFSSGSATIAVGGLHSAAVALNLSGIGHAGLAGLLRDFKESTVSAEHPEGLLLSVNDMSLPWGGVLDINGNFASPHMRHRRGRSVDFNDDVVDAQTLAVIANGLEVEPQLAIWQEVCRRNRGRVASELFTARLFHCEF